MKPRMSQRKPYLLYMKVSYHSYTCKPSPDQSLVIDARKKNQISENSNLTQPTAIEDTSLIRAPKFSKHGRRKGGDGLDPPRRAKRAEIQQREKEKTAQLLKTYETLKEIEDDSLMEEDEDAKSRWMSLAALLVEDFREARELFPVDRVTAFSFHSDYLALTGLVSMHYSLNLPNSKDWRRKRKIWRLVSKRKLTLMQVNLIQSTSLGLICAEKSTSRGKDFIPTTYRNIPIKNWLRLLVEVIE
jgi:hypothetical protein